MKWEKLKPPEPDDPMCCCDCDIFWSRCCCDCDSLDQAFNRYEGWKNSDMVLLHMIHIEGVFKLNIN